AAVAPVPAAAPVALAAPAPAASASVVQPAPVAGTIIRYAVNEGADVKSGETILVMESMKMELEIKSTAAGKVHFLVPTGKPVTAAQPIAEISGAAVPAAPVAAPTPAAVAPAPVAPAAPVPAAASVVQPAPVAGTVIRYAVNEGAEVKSGETILVMESMKMELEIKSTAAGKVHFLVPTGKPVTAAQPIAEIG
ncbi:MAG: acetyl-CoA carboxylase biotin carboxyl carrier protein subunit, partial [Treponema sp.]|nr:acetyl-CoA carboxylase biotin carboxyl carrier protein subunit [Treponema sp.]